MNKNELLKEVADLKLNGCATVRELKQSCSVVPDCKGVYFVLREKTESVPVFKAQSPVLEHKGKPLSYPVETLESKWVEDTDIMYIGKTDSSLRARIRTYISYGKGNDSPHRGGRAIWQLPDTDNMIIGWRIIDATESARTIEAQLLADFKNAHGGMLPFANFAE